jgi:hypothetical protein
MQGKEAMKSHRKITLAIGFLAMLSVLAPASASASASSLLSGYGGPGQGAQAILGSSLLNGPSRGGGGSGGGAPSGTAPAGGGSAGGARTGTAPLGAVSTRGRTTRPGTGGNRPASARNGSQSAASATGGGAYRSYPGLGSSRASVGGAGVLGLSDSAFLFALLALAGLVFTGLLTRGLAKASGTRRHAGN